MTARSAAAIAKPVLYPVLSLVLLSGAAACTSFYEIPIETPIQPKMDVSMFQRVLIAGFISGGTDDVDANLETVRLLRSQLRSKSSLRVIEAEVLQLQELAKEQGKGEGAPPPAPGGAADGQQTPLPQVAPVSTNAGADADAPKIRNEKDLEKYQSIFADVAFWKKVGEEYQGPLIITGTVLFSPLASAGYQPIEREYFDQLGRRRVIQQRVYQEKKGFTLQPKLIYIDGRSGAVLYSETLREEVLYPSQTNTPALSSYFELMDKLIPSFLNTLSTQKIRGTRVLVK